MTIRRSLGYLALGSAAWRGFRWYRNRRTKSQRWQLSEPREHNRLTGAERSYAEMDYGDDIDLREGQEAGLRRESWE